MSTILPEDRIFQLMQILERDFPSPKPALNFKNPFELLCAVMLSAQATDESVNKATPALFKVAPDPKSMAKLGEDGIAPYIKAIGLWRGKSKNLALMSQILVDDYDSQVPDDFKALIALPGVGEKTANVVLNVAFHHPTIAVDTHIFRVCRRTGLCIGKDALAVQQELPSIIPDEFKQEAHHRLLYHGRLVCTARNPHCDNCSVAVLCKKRL